MSKRLHVAYVCGDRGVPVGGRKGASAHVAELTRALVRRDVEVRILAARTADSIDTEYLPVPVFDFGSDRAARLMRQVLYAGARTARRREQVAEVRGLMLNQSLGKALERLHKRWRIDAVYERYSLWSYAAAGFARSARVPFLLEVNAPLREEQRRYRNLENPAAAASLEDYLFRSADRLIVPSEQLRPYVVAHGAAPGKVRVVPNAADPGLFRCGRAGNGCADEGEETFVVGFLGTLKPWHGIDGLARAFRVLHRKHNGYRLLIVGDGPMRPELEKSMRGYGLREAVTFTGEVAHSEVPELLARMDVAVAPYARMAGFYFSPLKLFEYMAAGVPIVASDIGQVGEILAHRKTALLQRPGAVREMAECIEQLRLQPALAERLAREARLLLGRRYTWARNAERVLTMIANQRNKYSRRSASGGNE